MLSSRISSHHLWNLRCACVLFMLWVTKSWATIGAVSFSDLQLRFSAVFLFCYLWVGLPQDSTSPGSVCLHPLCENSCWINLLWHQFKPSKWIRAVAVLKYVVEHVLIFHFFLDFLFFRRFTVCHSCNSLEAGEEFQRKTCCWKMPCNSARLKPQQSCFYSGWHFHSPLLIHILNVFFTCFEPI